MRMRTPIIVSVIFGALLVCVVSVQANVSSLARNLTVGDRGSDVLFLQQTLNRDAETRIALNGIGSPGQETDYFGSLTRAAVMKFQNKYRSEVLYPAGIFAPTGYVGAMTRAKISALAVAAVSPQVTAQPPVSKKTTIPSVTGVYPSFVREGDTFTVTGSNFTPTNNTVALLFGLLEVTFPGISSTDGKTLSVTYTPPTVPPITEEVLSRVAPEQLENIHKTLLSHYLTIDDLANPYKKFKNEAEFNEFLKPYNSSASDIKDPYVVSVRNANGGSREVGVKIEGMRHIAYASPLADTLGPFFMRLKEFAGKLIPTAYAQIPAGGFHASIVMYCTCPPFGYMSVIAGAGSTPSGLYFFPPWTIRLNTTSMLPGAFWLGYETPGAGICMFLYPNFPAFCAPILTGNLMDAYGAAF